MRKFRLGSPDDEKPLFAPRDSAAPKKAHGDGPEIAKVDEAFTHQGESQPTALPALIDTDQFGANRAETMFRAPVAGNAGQRDEGLSEGRAVQFLAIEAVERPGKIANFGQRRAGNGQHGLWCQIARENSS